MTKDKPWLRETCCSRTAHRETLVTQSLWRGAWVRGAVTGDGEALAPKIEVALICVRGYYSTDVLNYQANGNRVDLG